jgi:hypothetical protein
MAPVSGQFNRTQRVAERYDLGTFALIHDSRLGRHRYCRRRAGRPRDSGSGIPTASVSSAAVSNEISADPDVMQVGRAYYA